MSICGGQAISGRCNKCGASIDTTAATCYINYPDGVAVDNAHTIDELERRVAALEARNIGGQIGDAHKLWTCGCCGKEMTEGAYHVCGGDKIFDGQNTPEWILQAAKKSTKAFYRKEDAMTDKPTLCRTAIEDCYTETQQVVPCPNGELGCCVVHYADCFDWDATVNKIMALLKDVDRYAEMMEKTDE
jgi:ribosomal protein L37AE/L43A